MCGTPRLLATGVLRQPDTHAKGGTRRRGRGSQVAGRARRAAQQHPARPSKNSGPLQVTCAACQPDNRRRCGASTAQHPPEGHAKRLVLVRVDHAHQLRPRLVVLVQQHLLRRRREGRKVGAPLHPPAAAARCHRTWRVARPVLRAAQQPPAQAPAGPPTCELYSGTYCCSNSEKPWACLGAAIWAAAASAGAATALTRAAGCAAARPARMAWRSSASAEGPAAPRRPRSCSAERSRAPCGARRTPERTARLAAAAAAKPTAELLPSARLASMSVEASLAAVVGGSVWRCEQPRWEGRGWGCGRVCAWQRPQGHRWIATLDCCDGAGRQRALPGGHGRRGGRGP